MIDIKISKIIFVSFFAFATVFSFAQVETIQAQAQPIKEYVPLSPIPGTLGTLGTPNSNSKTTDLQTYLPAMFKIIIGLSAVLAIGWIIFGGIEYITTDSWNGKESGRAHIKNALLGLVMISASFVVLQTINKRLFDKDTGDIKIDLNIQSAVVPAGGGGGALSPGGQCTDCENLKDQIKFGANSNTYVSNQIAQKLRDLDAAIKTNGIPDGMMITEANPPTGQHADPCHANGTCVDASIPGLKNAQGTAGVTPNQDEATKILNFYNTAKAKGFSTVIFEVKTQEEVAAWAKFNVKATVTPLTTGSHFHIEK